MSGMVPFIDLEAQRARIQAEIETAVASVLRDGRYILGPQVQELEGQLKEFSGAPEALACANGTDALMLPLLAWGIGQGDAVFVPSFTFASTAEVVPWLQASPVFVDIEPSTYNMDPDHLESAIEATLAEGRLRPAVIIAVDLFGQPANYPRLAAIAEKYGLRLISDSAQGFGCTLDDKHPVHWADAVTISFYPAKPLGCYGDGGAVLAKAKEDYTLMKSFHVHGEGAERYEYARIGMNSRLDTIQAAILLEKLKIFSDEIEARNIAALRYADGFGDLVKTPQIIDGGRSVWAQYTIEVDDRDGFRKSLADQGVPTAVYYPIPLHKQAPYAVYPVGPQGLNATENAAGRVVSLPMDGYLGGERQQRVIDAVRNALS
ncbi:MAG: DegT/DnrJ/EryC1/StrS aminotransferase family protein [Alphaproteobacteria bacterium]|nr:DegT/DnrJ/EryC1/StrS aminotransferase family protein [Alphaproteobacteria bacterium]